MGNFILKFGIFSLFWLHPVFSFTNDGYGFTGTGSPQFTQKFKLTYYAIEGNYFTDTVAPFFSVNPIFDPLPGLKVVREIGKLDQRNDGFGYSSSDFEIQLEAYALDLIRWKLFPFSQKPTWTIFSPDINNIVTKEWIHIEKTMEREKLNIPKITGTIWEVGNEPNLFPLITPAEYADFFVKYYTRIKGNDSQARVALGALFTFETAPQLKDYLSETLKNILSQRMVENGFGSVLTGNPQLLTDVHSEIMNNVIDPIFNRNTYQFISEVIALLPDSISPDVISLHVYPFYNSIDSNTSTRLISDLSLLIDKINSIKNWPEDFKIWITEFGNIQADISESEINYRNNILSVYFDSTVSIERWLYYKPIGADKKLSILNDSTDVLTRLSVSPTFNPVDGNFSCSELNVLGRSYYNLSHGHSCEFDEVLEVNHPFTSSLHSISIPPMHEITDILKIAWVWQPSSSSKTQDWIDIKIYDPEGKLKKSVSKVLNAGKGEVKIRFDKKTEFHQGIYYLHLKTAGVEKIKSLYLTR